MSKEQEYEFTITIEQKTDGVTDGRTLVEEFSYDGKVHAIKTKVFTQELTEALSKAVDRLTDMAITGEVVED